MVDLTTQDMADKLMATGFSRSSPAAQSLSDPIADTPMVVTLDELRPYELDPRITRNPLYQEIKASIRERGLDAPPQITRRPGADHYIIRNGGNTRLAILRELWTETKDEQFFRIPCLFRPWPERGEIVALTGHLAENELRGGLTFIERALGIEKARELYELEDDKPLSQSELARRLSADGYPVQQSHISRMQDTICHLLPAIPNVLYAGLGRHQVERLAVLRKAAELTWENYAHAKKSDIDFETLFHETLTTFDTQIENFSVKRIQDELIGQMAGLLGVDYNILELDIDGIGNRQRAVTTPPLEPITALPASGIVNTIPTTSSISPEQNKSTTQDPIGIKSEKTPSQELPPHKQESVKEVINTSSFPNPDDNNSEHLQAPIGSPATSTERLHNIQQLVAEHTGEAIPNCSNNTLRAISVQADGLLPITDIWHIDADLDTPDCLRIHIAQIAQEIANEADLADTITPMDQGIGFMVSPATQPASVFGRTLLTLLHTLGSHHDINLLRPDALENFLLDEGIGVLLLGNTRSSTNAPLRLSDAGLVKFFRLLRLARHLQDSTTAPQPDR